MSNLHIRTRALFQMCPGDNPPTGSVTGDILRLQWRWHRWQALSRIWGEVT